jgi:hypothetical protein
MREGEGKSEGTLGTSRASIWLKAWLQSHREVTSITAPDRKKTETVWTEHSESPCATVTFGETNTYFRVGVEPYRAGVGVTFGLRTTYFETDRMRDAKDSVPMRPDEHGRERHSTRRSVGYLLLHCF